VGELPRGTVTFLVTDGLVRANRLVTLTGPGGLSVDEAVAYALGP
jgi:predicted ATPase